VAVACLVLMGCSALAIIQARKRSYLPVGWFWYLGTLVPVIGLVQVGSQAMADRYTQIPLIGLFLITVWGVRDLTAHLPRQKVVLAVSAGIVLTTCAFLTFQQVSYWQNSISLFKHAIKVTKNNGLAYVKLGGAYAIQGQIDKAIPLYQKAITINPNYSEGYNALGYAYIMQGKFDEAIPLCQKAIKINDKSADPYNNLAIAYANLGKLDEALLLFQQAVKIKPNFVEAYNNLGLTYANLGRFDEAIPILQQAIRINPKLTEPYNNLAMVYADQGKIDEAISILQKAILINPNNTFALELLNNLTGTRPGSK
jgi:tetratricopeptide (TPR) repeat protein